MATEQTPSASSGWFAGSKCDVVTEGAPLKGGGRNTLCLKSGVNVSADVFG